MPCHNTYTVQLCHFCSIWIFWKYADILKTAWRCSEQCYCLTAPVFLVRSLAQLSVCVEFHMLSLGSCWFLFTSQKHVIRWIVWAKLPLWMCEHTLTLQWTGIPVEVYSRLTLSVPVINRGFTLTRVKHLQEMNDWTDVYILSINNSSLHNA